MAPRWGSAQDKVLADLFASGKVNWQDLTQQSVEAVRKEYFPDREYKNFAPLFREKCSLWETNKAIANGRSGEKKSSAGKQKKTRDAKKLASIDLEADSDGDDDEDYDGAEEEYEDDGFVIPDGESQFPIRKNLAKGSKKTPVADVEVDKLTKKMTNTKISPAEGIETFAMPYVDYHFWNEDGEHLIAYDIFLFSGIGKKQVRPSVDATGMFLDIAVTLPTSFYSTDRVVRAREGRGVNVEVEDTSNVVTSFADAVGKIKNAAKGGGALRSIMRIKLPCKVKYDVQDLNGLHGYELQLHNHSNDEMIEYEQRFQILSLVLATYDPPRKKVPNHRIGLARFL